MVDSVNWSHRPHIWMESSAENVFRPAIEDYVDLLLNRILPLFSDPDGEQERASQEMIENGNWGPDHDYGTVMENAYHHGIERGLMLLEMRSVFLATSIAGLFHLFEKQVYQHLKKEFRYFPLSSDKGKTFEINSWNNADETIRHFSAGHDVTNQTLVEALDNPDLQELREVANAVKHGEGRATEALRKMKAPVVDQARLQADGFSGEFSVLNVSLSIEIDDVIRYKNALLGFWQVRGRFYSA